jgi:hypothetical protein
MSAFTSLLTRVLETVGPRVLPTDTGLIAGLQRQSSPVSTSITRWQLSDLEGAISAADGGKLWLAGKLWQSIRRDGTVLGVLSTRTDGLVQLPLRFAGDTDVAAQLALDFRSVFPSCELSLLSADGRGMGVGVAEFVKVEGSLPVLKRLDPEFLEYRQSEDRWYYQTQMAMVPVNPGDGRWVLHVPGGAVHPWKNGLWPALGRAFIAKEHAYFYRENYSSKLANAARVARSPSGAAQLLRENFFAKIASWGVNTVFELPPGWDVTLLESNGRGYEVFQDTIKTCNEEMIIAIAGQLVTTDGGAGFSNAAVHSTIRTDLIQSDADALSATLNTQALPVWLNERFGSSDAAISCAWDTTPPKDRTSEAAAIASIGTAITTVNNALHPYGQRLDVEELCRRFGISVLPGAVQSPDSEQSSPALRSIRGGRAA